MKSRRSSGIEACDLDPHHRAQPRGASGAPRTRAPGLRPLPRSPRRCRGSGGTGRWPSTSQPGNSWSRNRIRKLSRATKRRCALAPAVARRRQLPEPRPPGSAPAPGRRARLLSDSRRSFSAREKPRLGMNGNGWAGSIASGVSTGKMLAVEDRPRPPARSAAVTSLASSSTQAVGRPARRAARRQMPLLVGHQVVGRGVDLAQLLGRRSGRPG